MGSRLALVSRYSASFGMLLLSRDLVFMLLPLLARRSLAGAEHWHKVWACSPEQSLAPAFEPDSVLSYRPQDPILNHRPAAFSKKEPPRCLPCLIVLGHARSFRTSGM